MSILHLDGEKTWRGGENQLRLLLQGLKKRGLDNHVAAIEGTPAAIRLRDHASLVLITNDGYHWPSAYRLSKYIAKHNITIIDAHTSQTHSLALLVKWFVPTIKLVVHRRVDNPIKTNPLSLWKYRTPLVNHFVPISDAIKQILIAQKIAPSKITTVKSAVEIPTYESTAKTLAKLQLAQRFNIDQNQVFFGNASALDRQKDPSTLIEACALLKQRDIRFHCFLAGDGSLKKQLQNQIEATGLTNQITLVGFEQNVSEFLLGLDILAFPSTNEGLGTVLLDGLAAGCAVVATKVGGIPEIIIHEKTGLLVPPKDFSRLADALEKLITNQKLASQLAFDGLDHIKTHFSLESMVEGNLRIYQHVLANP